MNKKQKAVVWIALFLFVITLFNSPWNYRRYNTDFSGNYPVWSGPENGQLLVGSLFVEWFGIAVVGGVLFLLFKRKA